MFYDPKAWFLWKTFHGSHGGQREPWQVLLLINISGHMIYALITPSKTFANIWRYSVRKRPIGATFGSSLCCSTIEGGSVPHTKDASVILIELTCGSYSMRGDCCFIVSVLRAWLITKTGSKYKSAALRTYFFYNWGVLVHGHPGQDMLSQWLLVLHYSQSWCFCGSLPAWNQSLLKHDP